METVFLFLFLSILIAIMMLIVIWTYLNGISPMPTGSKVRKCLLEALPEEMEGKIIDLGSGWGTLTCSLARKYPCAQVIGFETSPIPYLWTWVLQRIHPYPNLCYENKDFFNASLQEANLIICYLYPAAMKRLKDKFARELKTGTWIVTHTFALHGWTPIETLEVDDFHQTKIYFYRIN